MFPLISLLTLSFRAENFTANFIGLNIHRLFWLQFTFRLWSKLWFGLWSSLRFWLGFPTSLVVTSFLFTASFLVAFAFAAFLAFLPVLTAPFPPPDPGLHPSCWIRSICSQIWIIKRNLNMSFFYDKNNNSYVY